jgi:hypothetical protein
VKFANLPSGTGTTGAVATGATGAGTSRGMSLFIHPRAVDLETPQRFASDERLVRAKLGSSRSCSSACARPMRRIAVTVTASIPSSQRIAP